MNSASVPSKILSLICLTIIHRFRPAWLAVTVVDAARELGVNPQRVSRLSTRAQTIFESTLAPMVRRGRPRKDRLAGEQAKRIAMLEALLAIASSLLAHISWRKPAIRSLVVGAYLRIQQEQPQITQQYFCETMALSPRTLRHWLKHPGDQSHASASPLKPPHMHNKATRKRPPRRHRFDFDLVLPQTQIAADTTNLTAFGIPLKLIATQDVGGRDQSLLESVIIDDHESADLVVQAFTEAIGGREGFQAIVDQGTPYMAELTQQSLEHLGAEHAPQVEGEPTAKSTMERAFLTVKSIGGPLLALTNRLAKRLPYLRNKSLAIALSTLLLSALLKAYQAGARAQRRADEARAGIPREQLLQLAQEHRRRSRAGERSKRLLLKLVHDSYDIGQPVQTFTRNLRKYPLEALIRAERAMRSQVHRDDIHNRAAYFAAIVRNKNEELSAERARRRYLQQNLQRIHALHQEHEARTKAWQDDPASWLRDAFNALAAQWIPDQHRLLCDGAGIGRAWLSSATALLAERHGPRAARDISDGIFQRFALVNTDRLGDEGLATIRAILDRYLPASSPSSAQAACPHDFATAILSGTGPQQRPAPEGALSIYPARPGGS